MKLTEGIHDYDIEGGRISSVYLLLKGALDNNLHAEPYRMAELEPNRMEMRYTPGREFYNPQRATPIYWSRFGNTLTVWPIPDRDYEIVIYMDEGVQKVEVEQQVIKTL